MSTQRKKPIARALHKFEGQAEHELSFSPGEAILLLKRVDENWLEGELDGKIGIFPANRVRIELGSPSLSAESALARSGRPCGVVLRDFNGDYDGDLPLQEGQIVELLGSVGSGWTRGRLDDKVGIFPASFVEIIQPLTESNPKPKPRQRVTGPVPKPRSTKLLTIDHPVCNGEDSLKMSSISTNDSHDTIPRPTSSSSSSLLQCTSVSSLERHISGLQSSLESEMKMMKSAQHLLKVSQNEEKRTKLTQTLANHKLKVNNIRRQIDTAEVQRDVLLSRQTKSAPTTPPSPYNSHSTTDDDKLQRQRVREELVNTEKDFYQEMSAFCTKVLPAFKQWKEELWEELFSNIEDVTMLSGELVKALEDSNEERGVGVVFTEFTSRLKEVYGVYCRNHDHASQLLEKLYEESGVASKVKAIMDTGRPEVQSWDLHTLLIKPIQRLLKYPLLLEKLMQATPKGHPNHKTLSFALKLSSQVAQDVNEIKRRKDILERYTGSGRDERRVNFGTMRKKVRRLQQTLTVITGLRSATIDPIYAGEEAKILSLENTLRALQLNIISWQEEGEHLMSCRDVLNNTMSDYVGKCPILTSTIELVQQMKHTWKEHVQELRCTVIDPLGTLISLFHDPLLLMSKRGDKLLDYDSLQHDLEKCTEPDKIQQLREQVTLAKRTYEALNTQLLEELPKFVERVTAAVTYLVSVYFQQCISYHQQMSTLLSSLSDTPLSSSSILQSQNKSLQLVLQRLCLLSIVPSSFAVSFGIILNNTTSQKSPRLVHTLSVDVPLSLSPNKALSTSTVPQSISHSDRRLSLQFTSSEPIYEEIKPLPDNDNELLTSTEVSTNKYYNLQQTTPTSPHIVLVHNYDEVCKDDPDSDHDYEIPPSPDSLLAPPTPTPSPFSEPNSPEGDSEGFDESSKRDYSISPDNDVAPPPIGTQLTVLFDFIAESSSELTVTSGDHVTLVCPSDGDGCNEWWLVELECNGTSLQGYVPSNYVETTS